MDDWIKQEVQNYIRNHGCQNVGIGYQHQLLVQLVDAESHLKQALQNQPWGAAGFAPFHNLSEWIRDNSGFTVTADNLYVALNPNSMDNSDVPNFNLPAKAENASGVTTDGPILFSSSDSVTSARKAQVISGSEAVALAPAGAASCDDAGTSPITSQIPTASADELDGQIDGHDEQSAKQIAHVLDMAMNGVGVVDSHGESEWAALTASAVATASGAWGDSHVNDSGTGSGASAWTTQSDVRPYGTDDAVPEDPVSRTASQDMATAIPRENDDEVSDDDGGGRAGGTGIKVTSARTAAAANKLQAAGLKKSHSLTTPAVAPREGVYKDEKGGKEREGREKEEELALLLSIAFPGADVQARLRRCLARLLAEKPAQLMCFAELGIRLARHSEAGPLWRDPAHRLPKLRDFVEAAAAAAPEALKVTRHAEWNNYGVSLDLVGLQKMALRRAVAAAYPGSDDVSVVRRAAAAALLEVDGPGVAVRFALNMPAMGQAVIQTAPEARQRLAASCGSTPFQLGTVLQGRAGGKPHANRNQYSEHESGEVGYGGSSSKDSNRSSSGGASSNSGGGSGGGGRGGYLSVGLAPTPGPKLARLDVRQLLQDAAAGALGDLTTVQPLQPPSNPGPATAAAAVPPAPTAVPAAAQPTSVPSAHSPAEGGAFSGVSKRVRDALRAAIPEHRPEHRAKRALALVAAASRGTTGGPPHSAPDPPYSLRSSPCGLMLADLGLKPPKGQMRALFDEEPEVFKAGRPSPNYLIELVWEPLRQLARTAPEEVAAAAATVLCGRTYMGLRLRPPGGNAAASEMTGPGNTGNTTARDNNYSNYNSARDNATSSTHQHLHSNSSNFTASANTTNRGQQQHLHQHQNQHGLNRNQNYHQDTAPTAASSGAATRGAGVSGVAGGGEPPGLAASRSSSSTITVPGPREIPPGQLADYFVRLERALDERLGAGGGGGGGGGMTAVHGSGSAAAEFLLRARLAVGRALLRRAPRGRNGGVGAGAVQLPPYTMLVKDVAMVLKRELPEAYQGADRRPPGTFPVNAIVLAQQLPLLFSVDNSGSARDWTIRLNVNTLELSAGLTPTSQPAATTKATTKATEPSRQHHHQHQQQAERTWSLDQEEGTWSLDEQGGTWSHENNGGRGVYGGEDAEDEEEPYPGDDDGGGSGGAENPEAEAYAAAAAAAAASCSGTMTAAAVAEVLATQPARALAAALAPTIPPDLLPDPAVHVVTMPHSAGHVTALAHCLSCSQIGLAAKCVGGVPAVVLLYAPAVESLKPAAASAAGAAAAAVPSPAGVLPATVYLLDAAAGGPTEGAVLLASLRGLMEEPGVAKVVHGCEQLVPGLEHVVGSPISPLLDTRLVSEMLKPLDLSPQPQLGGAAGEGGGGGVEGLKPDDGSTAPQLWPLPSRWQAALNTKYWDYHVAALQHASGADSSWIPRPLSTPRLGLAVRAVQHLPELWSALTWLLPRLAQFCSVARAQQCRALLGAPGGPAW